MKTATELHVSDLRAGDRYEHDGTHYYTVWAAPQPRLGHHEIVVPIQYADGGLGERIFAADATLRVVRP